jgi:hypothetical protein
MASICPSPLATIVLDLPIVADRLRLPNRAQTQGRGDILLLMVLGDLCVGESEPHFCGNQGLLGRESNLELAPRNRHLKSNEISSPSLMSDFFPERQLRSVQPSSNHNRSPLFYEDHGLPADGGSTDESRAVSHFLPTTEFYLL